MPAIVADIITGTWGTSVNDLNGREWQRVLMYLLCERQTVRIERKVLGEVFMETIIFFLPFHILLF